MDRYPRRPPHPLVITALLILLSTPAAGEEFTLEQIHDAWRQWRQQFVNVHAVFELVRDPHAEWAKQNNAVGSDSRTSQEWTWTDDGRTRNYMMGFLEGKPTRQSLDTIDSQYFYRVTYEEIGQDFEHPTRILISARPAGADGSAMAVTPFFGLYHNKLNSWLGGFIDQHPGQLVDVVRRKGREMPQVKFTYAGEYVLTLDPENAFLPCVSESGDWRNEVDEFSEIDGITVPWRGRMKTSPDTVTWAMKEMRLNETLSDKFFQPPLSKGVSVQNVLTGKQYVQGVTDAELEDHIVQTARNHVPAPSAKPTRWQSDGLWIVVLLLACSAPLVFLVWTRRR